MSPNFSKTIHLENERETIRFASAIAELLKPGDTILLEGELGTGKTFLARHIIQHRLAAIGRYEDVPSPSFTLVQTYDVGEIEIVHADLYRLERAGASVELGLEEVFETAICLIEWPDRLGELTPPGSLTLRLIQGPGPDQRELTLESPNCAWNARLRSILPDHMHSAEQFLSETPWDCAVRQPLAGDASNRRYERLTVDGEESVILMIAPPSSGEDVRPFISIARHLTALGLSAPRVLKADVEGGFLLLEDLGDRVYASYSAEYPQNERMIYEEAVDALVALHQQPPPSTVGAYDIPMLIERAALPVRWYLGQSVDCSFAAELEDLFEGVSGKSSVLALRDFHAENLLWLPERTGIERVGLLDFQDALACHPVYDLVSLAKDARRDLGEGLEELLTRRFLERSGHDHTRFRLAYSLYGAQRNLRILGVFARLAKRDGKLGYLKLIPRVWRHLENCLDHPRLERLRKLVMEILPQPTERYLADLESSCRRAP